MWSRSPIPVRVLSDDGELAMVETKGVGFMVGKDESRTPVNL